ncbi:MAG TPA: NAD(P)H-dependent oxidoreductase [Myxococcota bacterium]|nr:NAD(P)H-dependent oxidoreductase [Myxococcota bacterium]
MRVVGISGSLRSASHNTAALLACAELMPGGHDLVPLDYADVPLFNEDIGTPEAVVRVREAIAAADAVLIASPEYSHSIPGVLKNVLDWASRPAYRSALTGKRAGVISASPGAVGGARAQQHLKQVLLAIGVEVFPGAEVCIGGSGQRISDGRLVDEGTRTFLAGWLERFVGWAGR